MLKTSILVSAGSMARCFQVTRETIHQWTSGRVPHYVIGEASVRFHKTDLSLMIGSRLMLSNLVPGAKISIRKGQYMPMPQAFATPNLPPFLTPNDIKIALSISRAAAYRLLSPPYIQRRRAAGVELSITMAMMAVQFSSGGKILVPKEALKAYLDAVKIDPLDEAATLPLSVKTF